jgi:hypothetical protein
MDFRFAVNRFVAAIAVQAAQTYIIPLKIQGKDQTVVLHRYAERRCLNQPSDPHFGAVSRRRSFQKRREFKQFRAAQHSGLEEVYGYLVPMELKQTAMPRVKSNNVKVGCLFAAIGGFAKAFQLCGAKVLWANEKDRFAADTFRANFPSVRLIQKPIQTVSILGDELDPVDIVTAGFPCQPFSAAGEKRGFEDKERGMVFLDIIRLLGEFGKKKPKIHLLENVQCFRNHDRGRTFKRVQAEVQKAGYWFSDKNAVVLNTAVHTDIPQNRNRLFMVANFYASRGSAQ